MAIQMICKICPPDSKPPDPIWLHSGDTMETIIDFWRDTTGKILLHWEHKWTAEMDVELVFQHMEIWQDGLRVDKITIERV